MNKPVDIDWKTRTLHIPYNAEVHACDLCLDDKSVSCIVIAQKDLPVRGCVILDSIFSMPGLEMKGQVVEWKEVKEGLK